uniref:Opioid-binding protein/cell adhesion molecule n=1 Tax=Aceria tosichella TaxID=561515 RepID=A0A6G1SLI0_9ACAR
MLTKTMGRCVWLMMLLVAIQPNTASNLEQTEWMPRPLAPTRQEPPHRLASARRIKSDQENSLPVIKPIDAAGTNRNPGELGSKKSRPPPVARTIRDRPTDTSWAPPEDEDGFIRVDQNVQTGISKQANRSNGNGVRATLLLLSSSSASSPPSPAPQPITSTQRVIRPTGASKATELLDERSAALEHLNRFLLERPSQLADRTGGATLGRQLALRQSATAARTSGADGGAGAQALDMAGAPTGSSTTTTVSPQFDHLTRLYLDSSMPLEVRAHLGETAYLLCRLRANLQQADQLRVSWFRKLEILTSGDSRYTSDERFKASHQAGSSDWLLEIHNVRASDEGDYECQVNSTPRSVNVRVRLVVIATSLAILEGPEVRVEEGEQVELTCRVQFSSQAQLRAASQRPNHDSEPNKEDPDDNNNNKKRFHTESDVGGTEDDDVTSKRRRRRSSLITTSTSNWQPYIYWYKDQVYLQDNRVQRQQRNLSNGGSGLENVLRVSRASREDSGSYTCKLVPELTGVRPAQAQVLVLTNGATGGQSAKREFATANLTGAFLSLLIIFQAFYWPHAVNTLIKL